MPRIQSFYRITHKKQYFNDWKLLGFYFQCSKWWLQVSGNFKMLNCQKKYKYKNHKLLFRKKNNGVNKSLDPL